MLALRSLAHFSKPSKHTAFLQTNAEKCKQIDFFKSDDVEQDWYSVDHSVAVQSILCLHNWNRMYVSNKLINALKSSIFDDLVVRFQS